MKLMPTETPKEFAVADVTFLVKPKASAGDKFAVAMAKDQHEFAMVAIRRMLVGWRGVKDDQGHEVAYRAELLDLLPMTDGKNPLIELGAFIVKDTDIAKVEEVAKNA